MKTYVATTGTLFAMLVIVHVWRAMVEEPGKATDPWFLGISGLAAVLSFWAWRVYRGVGKQR